MRLRRRLATSLTNTTHACKSTVRDWLDRQQWPTSSTTHIRTGKEDDTRNTPVNDSSPPASDASQEPIVIAVIGQRHIGKSSLLQHGLHHTSSQQGLRTTPSSVDVKPIHMKNVQQHSVMLELTNKANTNPRQVMFLEIDHDPQEQDLTTMSAHAALICYDVTQLRSMAGVPDLLNHYCFHHELPVLLLGLKSDLASFRQVDSVLGEQLAQQHHVPFYEMKTTNALDIQLVLMKLIQQCIKSATETTEHDGTDHGTTPVKSSVNVPSGFTYAPTTTTHSTGPQLEDVSTTISTSTDNLVSRRRGSKDSCDSFGTGLTIEDIIDRLVSPESGRGDEQMIPIFMTFFRKFMTSTELVQALSKRFEADSCSPEQPTPLQKRITLVLTTWITKYWSDFYHQHTREQLNLLVDHISDLEHSSSMQHIIDALLTLADQPPPDCDIDESWGRKDCDTNEVYHNKKKDSGYISSYFIKGHLSYSIEPSTNDKSPDTTHHWSRPPNGDSTAPLMDRASSPSQQSSNSTNYGLRTSSSRINVVSPVTLSRSTSTSYPPSTYSSSGAPPITYTNRRNSSLRHYRLPYASINNRPSTRKSITTASLSLSSSPTPTVSQPEFSGGTIPIDVWNPPQPNSLSFPTDDSTSRSALDPSPPSPPSTSYLPSSSKPHLNKINAFYTKLTRPHSKRMTNSGGSTTPQDSTLTKFNTHLLLSSPDHEIAEQLTWIEAELFGRIESREFVRMIWASNNAKQRTRPSSMTSFGGDYRSMETSRCMQKSGLLASISHFNFISAWVISTVVMQPKLGKRVALLEKWMTIAVALRNLNNYNTLMAILAGINNAALLRLKQTQERIKKKKIFKRFQSLEKLMSSDKSFCSYRMALKASSTTPSIPYLGIHSQDLIALAEANKDIKTDGTVHWEKFRMMGECITATMQFQHLKHQMTPNPMLLNWIANHHILSEEEQYQLSIQAEPRAKRTRINNLRDIWSKM